MDGETQAEILRAGVNSMVVCVPDSWSNRQIREYATQDMPAAERANWQIRTQEQELISCVAHPGYVHVWLDKETDMNIPAMRKPSKVVRVGDFL